MKRLRDGSMNKEECLKSFTLMCEGMIEKDCNKLEKSMCQSARLIHMTGLVESREEYIKDILNGTLNYYDYQIIDFDIDRARIRLLARVYGGNKSWWNLTMYTSYQDENGLLKIKESKVRLG